MTIGEKVSLLRKQEGISQEQLAEKLLVSRQTISKWETGETVPESKKIQELCTLFDVSFDYLLDEKSENTKIDYEQMSEAIDWTSAWSKRYPVLATYQKQVDTEKYAKEITNLYKELQKNYGFTYTDAFLVLKDILYQVYKRDKKNQ